MNKHVRNGGYICVLVGGLAIGITLLAKNRPENNLEALLGMEGILLFVGMLLLLAYYTGKKKGTNTT